MTLTLGFSPCPNDTFIFDAMLNGKIDTQGISFDYIPEDVETLNKWAAAGRLDITKLSFSTYLHTVNRYMLLNSGSALGKGVGPLLVANKPLSKDTVTHASIAIPGFNTTANLLLTLAFPDAKNKTALLFSDIEDAVITGKYDMGLMIHEGRFTYEKKGLVKIMDMGDWWEGQMHVPIPLGGIVIKRDNNPELQKTVNSILTESLAYAWNHYPYLPPFVTTQAQEMEEAVMRQHINLYVNEYTHSLGDNGRAAIETLFEKAVAAGIISDDYRQYELFAV